MQYGFDDFDTDAVHGQQLNQKPIWAIDQDDKEILKWLNTEFSSIEKASKDRVNTVKKNIALYKGIQYYSQETKSSNRDTVDISSKHKQKTVVNHLYDFTEQKISRAVKFKPNVSIIPVNDTNEDRYSAKVTKAFYDHVSYKENIDDLDQDAIRKTVIAGEVYSFVEWDNSKGEQLEEQKIGQMLGIETSPFPVKNGDISIKNYLPHKVFPEMKDKWEDVNYLFRVDFEETEGLKAEYPQLSHQIHMDQREYSFTPESLLNQKVPRHTVVFTFYHKNTKYVPNGYEIKFTRDCILSKDVCKYSHGKIPCERLVEILVPGELHGQSFYIHIGPLQAHINNLTSMIMRNQYMAAHPKWLVPFGSTKVESLGNDLTIVQYRGATPPVLSQANPTGAETFNLRKMLIEESGQLSGVYGVSRGEPPPGIKAGVALQFLSEQENERQNAFLGNVSEYRKNLAKMIINVAADYYKPEDKRTVAIVGKNQEYLTEALDPKHLAKDYVVQIQNTNSLPKSVAARAQYIMDLSQAYPTIFSPEQIIDMLDLSNDSRFKNETTAAVRHAEDAYERLCEGAKVEDPQEYEDHITWWKVFAAKIQEYSFKRLPIDIRNGVLSHMNAREMLMFDKAQKNPLYGQTLSTLSAFPLIFEPEVPQVPDVPVDMMGMMPPEQANGPIMAQ